MDQWSKGAKEQRNKGIRKEELGIRKLKFKLLMKNLLLLEFSPTTRSKLFVGCWRELQQQQITD